MSDDHGGGVLNPVGPEEPRTYWIRRGLVAGGIVVLLLLIIWAVWPGRNTAASDGQPPSDAAPGETPSASVSAATTGSSATPSATTSGSPHPSATGPASATPTPPTNSPAATTSTPAASSTSVTPPSVTGCAPTATKVALTGPGTAMINKPSIFKVTVTNTGAQPCILQSSPNTLTLRIVSGADRIWSTANCEKWLPAGQPIKVAPGQSLAVSVSWPGLRSYSKCRLANNLRPGTYVAKAFYGTAPVGNLIFTLR